MNQSVDSGTRLILKTVGQALERGLPLSQSESLIRAKIDSIPWLTRYGKRQVREQAYMLLRKGKLWPKSSIALMLQSPKNFDMVMKAFNRAFRDAQSTAKASYYKGKLKSNRWKDDPVVFYLVSAHQKPAEKHAKYQNTILVDRYWRSTVPEEDRKSVASYIRNRNIITVQDAMGAPDYLIMRPNCKHFLTPIKTKTVLTKSPKAIAKEHPEANHGGQRSKTREQLRKEYQRSRRKLYLSLTVLNSSRRKPL